MSKLTLIIDVTESIDQEDVIEALNIEILCRLEEDDKMIKGWKWVREGDNE
jgi:hypothetical protein